MRTMVRLASLAAAAGALAMTGCYGDRYDDEPRYYDEEDGPQWRSTTDTDVQPRTGTRTDTRTEPTQTQRGAETWRTEPNTGQHRDMNSDGNLDREFNRDQAQGRDSGRMTASNVDQTFVREVAEANLIEVELGRLANEKADNVRVREFGQKMVQDHTDANRELQQIARGQGIEIPTTLPQNLRRHVDELSRLNGAEFDRKFISKMVEDHQKVIQKFETVGRNGQNGAIREFANETLPHLREHLHMAKEIQGQLGR